MAKAKGGKLTPKQEKFCLRFHECGNASDAYRHAYNTQNMKPESVNRLAKAALDNVKIASRLKDLMSPALKKAEVTAERIVNELSRIAFGDLRDVVEWGAKGVTLKESSGLTPEQAAAISEVSETVTKDGGSMRIKRHDKVKALELLMRHKGMLLDKVEHSGSVDLAKALTEARKRASD